MSSYKEPSFEERAALAKKAKQDALDKLRAKAPIDDATLAARREAAQLREAKQAKAREDKLAARDLEKQQKRERSIPNPSSEADNAAATEEDRKAARDAKYAARKKRKK